MPRKKKQIDPNIVKVEDKMIGLGELTKGKKVRRGNNAPAPLFAANVDVDTRAAKIREAYKLIQKQLTTPALILAFLTSVARRILAGTLTRQDGAVLNGIANTCLNAIRQEGSTEGLQTVLVRFGEKTKDGKTKAVEVKIEKATTKQIDAVLDRLTPEVEPIVIVDEDHQQPTGS